MSFQRLNRTAQALLCSFIALLLVSGMGSLIQMAGTASGATMQQATLPATSIPPLMNYQGILRDPEGNPMSGAFKMTFRVYHDVTAPSTGAVWTEVHEAVTVRDGQFNALLGNNVPIPASLFASADVFIGVQVDPFDEMVPRQRFASVPYAAHADYANGLQMPGGQAVDALFVDGNGKLVATESLTLNNGGYLSGTVTVNSNTPLVINATSGQSVGVGTSDPHATLHVNSNGSWSRVRLQNHNAVLDLDANGGAVAVGATNSLLTVYSKDELRLTSGIFGGNSNILLNATTNGNVGIGNINPQTRLDVSGSTNVRGNLTVNQHAPIHIVRYRNVGNDADFTVGFSAQDWNCIAAGWSATWANRTQAGVNMVWTYVNGDGDWWVRASFNSTGDDENPDVDVLCFRTEISTFEGDKTLNEPN